jgi:hypothetical protein
LERGYAEEAAVSSGVGYGRLLNTFQTLLNVRNAICQKANLTPKPPIYVDIITALNQQAHDFAVEKCKILTCCKSIVIEVFDMGIEWGLNPEEVPCGR